MWKGAKKMPELSFLRRLYYDYGMSPTISIIMPTYNRANLLPRAIDSVLAQSETSWELIIIDDGSTDDTTTALRPYLEQHKHIQYYKHSNRGAGRSINIGFKKAKGEYVTILCSDDEYKPNHLAQRLYYMVQHPEVAFIHGGVEIIGDEYVPDKDDPTKKIHLSQCAIGGTFFAKREVINAIGGFKPIPLAADANMVEEVAQRYTVAKVSFPTYIYHREGDDSLTKKYEREAKNKA